MASLKGLADARAWARSEPDVDPEWSAVAVLPQLLDAEDIALLHRAAQQCGERLAATGGGPFAGGGLCDTSSLRTCGRQSRRRSSSRERLPSGWCSYAARTR